MDGYMPGSNMMRITASANKHKAVQRSTGLYSTTDGTERYLLIQRFTVLCTFINKALGAQASQPGRMYRNLYMLVYTCPQSP